MKIKIDVQKWGSGVIHNSQDQKCALGFLAEGLGIPTKDRTGGDESIYADLIFKGITEPSAFYGANDTLLWYFNSTGKIQKSLLKHLIRAFNSYGFDVEFVNHGIKLKRELEAKKNEQVQSRNVEISSRKVVSGRFTKSDTKEVVGVK